MLPRRYGPCGTLVVAAVLAAAADASAVRIRIDARTGALAYPVVGRDGLVVLDERLVESRLLLRLDDLIPLDGPSADPAEEPDVVLASSMRWYANVGIAASNTDPGNTRFVPGLDDAALDVLYAYAEATNLAHGLFDLRAGRLVHSGPVGWRSDDGVLVRLAPARSIRFQAIGGFENVRGLRLSVSPFAPDGVERWAGEGEGADRYGEPHEPRHRPTVQMSLDGVAGAIGYDVAYRRTWRSVDGGLAEEAAGLAVDATFGPVVVAGTARLDLGAGFVSDASARAALRLSGGAHRIEALYQYFRPTFDLESIFVVFASNPFHEATVRWRFPLPGALSGEAWASGRRVEEAEEDGDAEPVAGPFTDLGGGAALALAGDRWNGSARWKIIRGTATSLAAFDLHAAVEIGRSWELFATASAWQYEDRVRAKGYGVGGGGRAGAAVEVADGIRIEVEAQLADDRREGTTFAVFAWLDLGVTL